MRLNLFSYLRIEPEVKTYTAEIATQDEKGDAEVLTHVDAKIGRVVFDVYLRKATQEYQIQKRDPRTYISGVKAHGRLTHPPDQRNVGAKDDHAWKPLGTVTPGTEREIVELAVKLLIQDQNWKIVKLAKWCGRGVVSIPSTISNVTRKPRVRQAAFVTTAAVVAVLGGFYLRKANPLSYISSACGFSYNVEHPSAPEDWQQLWGNITTTVLNFWNNKQ